MKSISFQPIPVGSVLDAPEVYRPVTLIPDNKITIHYPARLEAMALDPSQIAEREDRIYRAGQINFIVSVFKHVSIQVIEGEGKIVISDRTPRPALVRHAAIMMQKVLGFNESIAIDVVEDLSLRHCGLGSSSGSVASVASAINELFSCPLDAASLSRLCTQNHGEEVDSDPSKITPVQCLGGSVIGGNYEGGLMIVAGRATPIFTMQIPSDLSVVIGVPQDYKHPDSAELMKQETENMEGFISSGQTYAREIAYNLVHDVIPDLVEGSLKSCKELIYQYRWNMGSIKNCSFALPRIVDIAEELRKYQHDEEIEIFSLSSVGPGFFALTTNPKKVVKDFHKLNMRTFVTTIYNDTYKIGD